MTSSFNEFLLRTTLSSKCEEIEVIQSLWSGYGKISRFQLNNPDLNTVVVKWISLRPNSQHPKGWNTETSHARKVKSYQVETSWYKHWNKECSSKCKTPNFLGAYSEGTSQWIILEDLNVRFPVKKQNITIPEIKVCLKWLANFHSNFLGKDPQNLWQIGTYWNLATRPDEYAKMDYPELKAKAHHIDNMLNQCKYQTIIHGDAKLANFCFSKDGKQVAAVDFQYTGGGCGIKDVSYLMGSCLSSDQSEIHQDEILDYYFSELRKALDYSRINLNELETEWRKLYPISCADFTRFLLGWMPSHKKINAYNLNIMESVLASMK